MATVEQTLDIARAQIGITESPANSNCQKFSKDLARPCEPWCADSVCWIQRQAGVHLPSESAYTPYMYNGFVKAGTAVKDLVHGLRPGDVIFFDFKAPFNTNGIQHVGIFVSYAEPGYANTLEGNCLPVETPVLTASGWVPIGDLKVGQSVIDPYGNYSEVKAIHNKGVQPVYEVSTSDGSNVEATKDHLWEVDNICARGKKRVLTTGQLADLKGSRFVLPAVTPPDLGDGSELPLDPWLIGVLLGDGGMTSGSIMFTSVDQELLDGVTSLLPDGVTLKHSVGADYRISSSLRTAEGYNYNPILSRVRALDIDRHSYDKRIPHSYLFASAKDRLALLQGLMDTDGDCDKQGRACFSSSSEQLAQDVQFLVRSLGGKCAVNVKRGVRYTSPKQKESKAARDSFRVQNIRFADSSTTPFSLSRKAARWVGNKKSKRGWVVSVSETPTRETEVACIEVSAPSHLYITKDWLPTHNTSSGDGGSQDNGGGYYPRKRPLSFIVGAGRPAYEAAPAPAPEEVHPVDHPSGVIEANRPIVTLLAGNDGYWIATDDGGIFGFNVPFHGSLGGVALAAPVVGGSVTPDAGGYWLVAADGGVFALGNAASFGSMGGQHLNAPVVGMAPTPDGGGYWLVGADGGIFNFGNAAFHGSAGGAALAAPIVGIAATPDGGGYWLLGKDGGVFSYGNAAFHGSTGGIRLSKDVVGMAATPSGQGYWLVGADGGVFAFGDAGFFGSAGNITLAAPVVSIRRSGSGQGYWLVASDGGIFSFGDASFHGAVHFG